MSLPRGVSWHRTMISPWTGVEHLDRSDSQWGQRVFVSCWGMCRGGFTAYLHDAGWGRRGREWEGCDGSKEQSRPSSVSLLGWSTRAAVAQEGGSGVEKIGRMAERAALELDLP